MFLLRLLPRCGLLAAVLPSLLAGSGPRPPTQIVAEQCAGCHGAVLTGGLGPNLLDWGENHGNDRESVRFSIVNGWPLNGMPSFGGVLATAEIDALVDHIFEQRKEYSAGRVRPPVPPDTIEIASERQKFRLDTVVRDLKTAWGLAILPDGRFLVTEREGNLSLFTADGRKRENIRGVPAPYVARDGGMLDVALHPDYARNGWIYLSYAEAIGPEKRAMTVIVRGRIRAGKWVDQQTIFRAPEQFYTPEDYSHYGCRLLFDGAGYLFFGIGERGLVAESQKLSTPLGKIHRVHDDGRVPADNPFRHHADAWPTIWSYGHRHPQGLEFHPEDRSLWSTEHGPRGGDELNVILPGRNYGWPLISHGQPQFGEAIGGTHADGLEQPAAFWPLSIAPSSILFCTTDKFPGWRNSLLVTTLIGEHVRRVEIAGGRVVHQEILFQRFGRARDLAIGPDGLIYIVLNNPGRIVRLTPLE